MDQAGQSMTEKILCPIDARDHGTIGFISAAEFAKAIGSHLAIFAVNIAVGGVRDLPTSRWKTEELKKFLADAEAITHSEGATNVGTIEVVARESAPAMIAYAEQTGYSDIVMGTDDKPSLSRLIFDLLQRKSQPARNARRRLATNDSSGQTSRVICAMTPGGEAFWS